ncbi:MAG: hypothetical protein IJ011_06105 [Clostridia bacterium]|nr:hypothetical protein [Clostridia bacterium]
MKKRLTRITAVHYVKLIYRSILFFAGIALYAFSLKDGRDIDFTPDSFGAEAVILGVIFAVYALEMITRLFPSRLESMGCQKQFKRNYEPTGNTAPSNVPWWRTFVTATAWFTLNGIIGALYLFGVIDAGILLIVSLAYGICDMICVLFYCPFHSILLRSRCCVDCRIYNWDFAMMFTPFVFIANNWFTAPLLALSLVILIRWEITYKAHPERFSRNTNKCLDCAHCEEKLCKHKKQLASYLKKNADRFKTMK